MIKSAHIRIHFRQSRLQDPKFGVPKSQNGSFLNPHVVKYSLLMPCYCDEYAISGEIPKIDSVLGDPQFTVALGNPNIATYYMISWIPPDGDLSSKNDHFFSRTVDCNSSGAYSGPACRIPVAFKQL